MSATPVRIGILGTGTIALRALIDPARSVPEVAVTAVASRDPLRANDFAASHGIGRATDYDGLLADPEVDVVYVTLPNSLHAQWSIRALEAGKHVLCEKPMSANAAEAEQVAAAVDRSGRLYLEAYHQEHHPFHARVLDLVASGAVGDVQHVDVTFQIPGKYIAPTNIRRDYDLGGGALMDAGCYCVHLLRRLLGEPERVVEARADLSDADPRVDLGMTASLAFPGGTTASLRASFLAEDTADVVTTIRGTAGELQVTSIFVPQWGGRLRLTTGDGTVEEDADPTPSYVFQLRHLVRCLREGAPVVTSADDGVRTMRTLDLVYQAAGLPLRGPVAAPSQERV